MAHGDRQNCLCSLLHVIEGTAQGRFEGFVPISSRLVDNTHGLTLKSTKREHFVDNVRFCETQFGNFQC